MTIERFTGTICQFAGTGACDKYVQLTTQLNREETVEEADLYISEVCHRGGYDCAIKKILEEKNGA